MKRVKLAASAQSKFPPPIISYTSSRQRMLSWGELVTGTKPVPKTDCEHHSLVLNPVKPEQSKLALSFTEATIISSSTATSQQLGHWVLLLSASTVRRSRGVVTVTPGKIAMTLLTCSSSRVEQPHQEDGHTALLPPATGHLGPLFFPRDLHQPSFSSIVAQKNSHLGLTVISAVQKSDLDLRNVTF